MTNTTIETLIKSWNAANGSPMDTNQTEQVVFVNIFHIYTNLSSIEARLADETDLSAAERSSLSLAIYNFNMGTAE